MGPMAQDFWPAFGLGEDPLRIGTIDADGVALAAIQGLGLRLHDTELELELHAANINELQTALQQQSSQGGVAGGITSFVAVSGNGFNPSSDTTGYARFLEGIRGTSSGELVRFFAPIDLPHGATVTAFEAQVLDNDATQNVSLSLGFITDTGGVGSMATLASTGAAANARTFSTTTITQGAVIDNQNRSYHVNANWTVPTTSFNIRLARVSVTFTLP
jgi:hypothetical protein